MGALLVSVPIVLALFKEKPEDASTDNLQEAKSNTASWGITSGQAMRTGRFWILGVVIFVTVIVVAGLLSNFEPIMRERGFERSSIAQIAAVMGLTVILGRLLVGVLVDRYWAPGVAACFFLFPTLGLLIFMNTEVTLATGMVVAIMVGLAAGAELDLLAYLTSKYFGPAHYPAIFGLIIAFFTVGAGIAPPLFGGAAAASGGYDGILTISIGLLVLSIVLFLMLGKYPEQAVAVPED